VRQWSSFPFAADCCPCVEKLRTRVTINCWCQRRCGASGVHLMEHRLEGVGTQVYMEQVPAARSAMRAVQVSEVALAAGMGVPLVATSMAHSRDARYSAFLHRALVYARARPTQEGRGVDDSCLVSTLTLDILTHREQLRYPNASHKGES
jgi:hypothetical protein